MLCFLPMVRACLIEKSLKIVTTTVNETYTTLYECDYVVDLTGSVTKGGGLITEDNRLIDSIKEGTGLEVLRSV